MLKSVYDPVGIVQQLVGVDFTQILRNKSHIQPIMVTDILLSNVGPDYTIKWDIPPSAISLLIANPGSVSDHFVFRNSLDTLTRKTLTQPIIADFTLAQHSHTGADSGGLIGGANYAWARGSQLPQVVTTSWVTAGLDVIPLQSGGGITLLNDAILPVEPGTYEIHQSVQWNCDDGDDADLVTVRWQRFNSTSGLWEGIPGT